MKVHVWIKLLQKIWQSYSLEWYQYHAGLCVLQERVIFQTHPGLLANTLKTRKWNWFVLFSERGAGISTGQGLAISADCRNMDYSQFSYTRKQHRSVFNFCLTDTLLDVWAHFTKIVVFQWPQISCAPHSLVGPPWCLPYWLGFRLLLAKTGRSVCAQCPHAAT